MCSQDESISTEAGVLAGLAVGDEVCVVLEHVDTSDHIHGRGLGEGLSGVERFSLGEDVVSFAEESGGAKQDGRTLWCGCLRPFGKG